MRRLEFFLRASLTRVPSYQSAPLRSPESSVRVIEGLSHASDHTPALLRLLLEGHRQKISELSSDLRLYLLCDLFSYLIAEEGPGITINTATS